jgi:hypothetical protein
MQSLASLNILHLRNQAIFNKRYFADNGRVYTGTKDGKLKLEDKAVETSFSPTTAIPETNVQDAIENLSSGSNIGSLLTDTATIDFVYNPIVPASITANLKNTSVTAGTYGSAVFSPRIIIDAQGRITSATNVAIAIAPGVISLTQNHILVGNAANIAVDVAMSGEASIVAAGTVTLLNSAVIGKVLTGYVSGAGVLAATDTILQAFQKLNGNVSALVTGVSSVNLLTGAVALTGTANRITISAANLFDIGTDVVTLTGGQALSNKTGLISQWTNDTAYLTSTVITAGQIGFGSAGNTLTSDPTFVWNNTAKDFTITGTISQILSNTANVWYVAQGNVGYWFTGAASTGLSNHQGFGIDFKTNNKYTMGDVGITNNTHIEVNDTAQTVKITNLAGIGTRMIVSDASGFITTQAITTGTVTSVSGTLNRITSTGGATPVIDISASYVGQSSITTIGTITSGTWNGGVVSPVYGGTGIANNVASTLTISGSFASTLTVTGVTGVTLPTSGTLYGTLANSITSAQLASSLTDETGTLLAVFSDSPTFTTQIITPLIYGGTVASGDMIIDSTSDVTKTSAYLWLQPTGGRVGIGILTAPDGSLDVIARSNGNGISIKTNSATVAGAASLSFYTQANRGLGSQVFPNSTGTGGLDFYVNAATTLAMSILSSGKVGVNVATPLSILHLKAGTATANTAPLQFNSGALEAVSRAGVIEFLTDAWYGTITTGAVRKTFAFLESPIFTGVVTITTPFTLGATSVTTTGTKLNYLTSATGTTGTASTNVVFSESPAFTSIPTAPTAAALTNTTQIATTAFVTSAMSGVVNVYEATVTITTAQVLQLNTTPIQIIAAPGAGKYIEVVSASVSVTYNSIPYITNTILILINTGAVARQFTNTGALQTTVTTNFLFVPSNQINASTDTQCITNTALNVSTATGNTTLGNSDIKVKVIYRIVTI